MFNKKKRAQFKKKTCEHSKLILIQYQFKIKSDSIYGQIVSL